MPNYDIIPLAVDLLDYTIQRVKTKEPEYRKIKALVQENGQLAERELFEKIRDDGFDYAAETNMTFMGFEGKPAGYFIIFCVCAVAYLVGWIIMKALVPKYKPVDA